MQLQDASAGGPEEGCRALFIQQRDAGGSKGDGASLLEARRNLLRKKRAGNLSAVDTLKSQRAHLATFKDSRSGSGLRGGHSVSLPMSKEPRCHVSQCTSGVISNQ